MARHFSTVRAARLSFVVILVSALVAGLGIGAAVYIRINDESELRDALIVNCEDNGNPLREAEIEDLEEGITEVNDPLIKVLFPNVPKAVTDKLIRQGNKIKRQRIEGIQPLDCASQYP